MRGPPLPEGLRGGKIVQEQLPLDDAIGVNLVVKQETVAVGAEHERNLQHLGIAQTLLHTVADGVIVVLIQSTT